MILRYAHTWGSDIATSPSPAALPVARPFDPTIAMMVTMPMLQIYHLWCWHQIFGAEQGLLLMRLWLFWLRLQVPFHGCSFADSFLSCFRGCPYDGHRRFEATETDATAACIVRSVRATTEPSTRSPPQSSTDQGCRDLSFQISHAVEGFRILRLGLVNLDTTLCPS